MAAFINRLGSARALLNWLKTVDGTGSGLDADTVDGVHVSAGTYTPTATLILNLDAATPYLASYTRIGNVVSVAGVATVDATVAAQCQLDLTLPIASALTSITQLAGAGAIIGASSVYIVGQATDDKVRFYWNATAGAAINLSYSYQYQVI